jgi:hypothetical protein
MKPGQIRQLYLEPRLHKQSVKQEINNHGTCLAKPLRTKQQKNVWRTIGLPSMMFLSDLPKICPFGPTNFKNSDLLWKTCTMSAQLMKEKWLFTMFNVKIITPLLWHLLLPQTNARHFGTGTIRHLWETFRNQDSSAPGQFGTFFLWFYLQNFQ